MNVDRTGNFRCQATEHTVNKSTGGFPQLVARLFLTEWYDQDEEQWVDFSEFGMGITAYFTLYGRVKGKDNIGPTLNHQQVSKIFNWDGKSFADLANKDCSELLFQVRIDENSYEGAKNPYQVGWIDEYDADPNRQLKKLDPKDIKALDSEFIGSVTPKAVSANKPAPKVPAKTRPETADEKQAVLKAKSTRLKAEAEKAAAEKKKVPPTKKAAPPTRKPTSAETTTDEIKGHCTKQEAWETVTELKDPECSDKKLEAYWNTSINEIAGEDTPDETITDEQWYEIKERVMSECGLF